MVCQKIISKAEGALVRLAEVEPSEKARQLAAAWDKDPRQVEVALRESARIVREGHGVLVCETRHGFVCANAGVDLSNAPEDEVAVLLPRDPDGSARRLREALREARPLGVPSGRSRAQSGRHWRPESVMSGEERSESSS